MKHLVKFIAVMGILFLTSGCATSSQAKLEQMNSGVCSNPKCQCPKPCQCGAGCRCGQNGNPTNMSES